MVNKASKTRSNTRAYQEDEDYVGKKYVGGIVTRKSVRLMEKLTAQGEGPTAQQSSSIQEERSFSTPSNQHVAEDPRSVRNRMITRCVNSVTTSRKEATTKGSHVPCLNRCDPVALLGNRTEKGKQIAGKRTCNDQPSLGSLVDSVEEEPTTLVPNASNLLSKNSSSLPQTQPQVVQDGGSMTPIAHCSLLQPPTGNEESRRLIEKFSKMRSILEKDRNMREHLVPPIQYDAPDADLGVRVKTEPICIDLEAGTVYIVGKDYESILSKIMSAHGDIAKDSIFTWDIRTKLVETVCKIYKKLEASNILEIDVSEMTNILQTLDQLHHAKLEVKWLMKRVSQRIESTEELPRIMTLKNIAKRKSVKIEERAVKLEGYKSKLEFLENRCKQLKKSIMEEGEELASETRLTEVFNIISESWVKKHQIRCRTFCS